MKHEKPHQNMKNYNQLKMVDSLNTIDHNPNVHCYVYAANSPHLICENSYMTLMAQGAQLQIFHDSVVLQFPEDT